MIAKLIVWDRDRDGALRQMSKALRATAVAGLKTNLEFLGRIIDHPAFAKADIDTGFIERHRDYLMPEGKVADHNILALASMAELEPHQTGPDPWGFSDGWRMNLNLQTLLTFVDHDEKREVQVTYREKGFHLLIEGDELEVQILRHDGVELDIAVNGHKVSAKVIQNGQDFTIFHGATVSYLHHYLPGAEGEDEDSGGGVIITPMPGKVSQVMVKDGEVVEAGQPLMILEAMKMEHTIKAQISGTIEGFALAAGDQVADGQILIHIVEAES